MTAHAARLCLAQIAGTITQAERHLVMLMLAVAETSQDNGDAR